MKKNRNIKREIKNCYTKFFKEVGIDFISGIFKNDEKLKFATYPYIGNQYGEPPKILFVGLDIGKDEYQNSIGSLKERQESIGNENNYTNTTYNPHIAGTSVTAAYFSNKDKIKDKILGKIKNAKNYKEAIGILQKEGMENPLSYVALTNFYKRVTQGRYKRTGSDDRKPFSEESHKYELKLLLCEIKIFCPDIIIFQSVEFNNTKKYGNFLKELRNQNKRTEIHIGPHPTCRPPYYSQIPKKYLSYFKLIDEIK